MRSQRFISRFVAFALLLSAFLILPAWLVQDVPSPIVELDELMERSHRVLAYQIDYSRNALFKLLPGESSIEIITNLDINTRETVGPDMEFSYSIYTTLMDENFSPLSTRTIWHQTRHSSWIEKETGHLLTSAFFLNDDIIPCDSRIFTFELDHAVEDVQYLRVKLDEPADGSASIRVYRHEDLLKGRELSAVLPLKSRLKAKLARHNLFGQKVKEVELRRFLSDILQQIPAEGRSGEDYITRALYLYDEEIPIMGEQQSNPIQELQPNQSLMMSLNGPANVSITAASSGIVYYNLLANDRYHPDVEMSLDPGIASQIPIPAGKHLVSIRSSADPIPVKINVAPLTAIITTDGKPADDPVQSRSVSYFRALPDSEEPIIIELPATRNIEPEPIKIVCRKPLDINSLDSQMKISIEYEFLDLQRKVIHFGTLEGHTRQSRFARYDNAGLQETQIPSFPERFFLKPPLGASELLIWTDSPVDLAFYSCLSKTSPVVQKIVSSESELPDLFCVSMESNSDWFYFKPINGEELKLENRTMSVNLPVEILELPILESSAFKRASYQTHAPRNPQIPIIIMEKSTDIENEHTATQTIRLASRSNIEMEVRSGISVFDRLPIKYHLLSDHWGEIDVFIDQVQKVSFRPITRGGVFHLAGLKPGHHVLRIESDSPDDLFWSHERESVVLKGEKRRLRRVYELEPGKTMDVDIEKISWDATALNISVYSGGDNTDDIQLTAECNSLPEMQAGRSSRQLTISKRTWIGRNASENHIPATSDLDLSKVIQVAFPIQDDIPPGVYRITLSNDQAIPLFLRFFSKSRNE